MTIDEQAEKEGKALKRQPKSRPRGRGRINRRDIYGKEKFERLFRC